MRPLTLVMAFFQNAGMLAEHFKVWAEYPADLKPYLRVIVVDDATPKAIRPMPSSLADVGLASVSLYRIVTKARWNWLACRNLAMAQSRTEWALMTDIDHVLPAETLRRIVTGDLVAEHVYRLSRVDAPRPWPYALSDCTPYKYHPDTWLLTRQMFDRAGGYDERFSGCYGTSGEWRDRVMATAKAEVRLTDVMIRYPREIIADASTHPSVYTRKGDPKNDAEFAARRRKRDLIPNWRPERLTFPWVFVASVGKGGEPLLEASA